MNIGVIFAGGAGTRMHTVDTPKQFLVVYGKPVIIHTLEYFEQCEDIDAVVISCIAGWEVHLQELLEQYHISKVRKIVPGGATGQLSIYNGLCAADEVAGGEKSVVLIHDGVRPLISAGLLKENIESVKKYGSAITTGAVYETIVVTNSANEITSIPDREACRVAKAPQSFWLDEVLTVEREAIAAGETSAYDTCCLMNAHGHSLHMIEGPVENIKVTTPDDIYIFRSVLEKRENKQIYGL